MNNPTTLEEQVCEAMSTAHATERIPVSDSQDDADYSLNVGQDSF
jgi:hypothetical protein